MARSLVMCPATQSLELIEFAKTPLGALIHACSRFRPATSVSCGRACAQNGRCDLGNSDSVFDIFDDEDTAIDIEPLPEIPGSAEQS
jgi:hypothetical protein